jgi:hypothetical protein
MRRCRAPAEGRTGINNYSLADNAPLQGTNFYRLRMIHANGTASYSSVIHIARDGSKPSVMVYPSPVTGKELNIQLSGLKKGVYQATLYNGSGQLVQTTSISYDGGTLIQAVQLPANLSKGMYHLQVKKDDTQFNQSIIVQ